MLDKFLDLVKKPAKWGMVGALLAAALFSLLANAGNLGGGFMPVVGGLFVLVIEVALWACVPVLVLLKKEDLAKKFLLPVLFYWYVTTLINFFSGAGMARANMPGVAVACGVFEFLLGLALLAAVALYVLAKIQKKALFEKLAYCVFGGSFLLFLLTFALMMALEARWGGAWNDYFAVILNYLLLPVGFFFACLYFYPPQAEEVAAPVADEAPTADEAPIVAEEETVVEETSVAEPVEEPAEEPAAEEAAATDAPVDTSDAQE